jgi:hypothetical protein
MMLKPVDFDLVHAMTSVLGMTINGPAFNVFMNAAGRPTM